MRLKRSVAAWLHWPLRHQRNDGRRTESTSREISRRRAFVIMAKASSASGLDAAVLTRALASSTSLTDDFVKNSDTILRLAMQSLFERLNSLCEGAIAVDEHARIVWINSKYIATLGLNSAQEALGR